MNEMQKMNKDLYRSGDEFDVSMIPVIEGEDVADAFVGHVNKTLEKYSLKWLPEASAVYIVDGQSWEDVERRLPEGTDFTQFFVNEIIPDATFAVAGEDVIEVPEA